MKIRMLVVAWVLALLTASLGARAQGQTYYVDPGGLDSYPGTQQYPWRTIQHAASQVAAGDTVLINPGPYAGGITVDTPGTAGNPITFRAAGPGVVVEGSGSDRDAFFITEADHIVVEGLTIQHATRAGLRISLSDHVTVQDCTFADNGTWGVFTDFSDYTTVENCVSYGAGDEHGIYISNSSDYPTIRDNVLHHNHSCGLHMNGDASMGGDGVISYALVERNVIYENGVGGGSGINMDGVTHSIVRNNLLYDNHASGVSLYQIDGGSGSHDNRVLNNTIVMPADGRWAINIPNTNATGNQVFNNIIYSYHAWRGGILIATPGLAGFQSDYNVVVDRFCTDGEGDVVIDLAAWQALGYDTHSFVATPDQLFVDLAGDDYHLKPGSPAVDAGTALPDVFDDLEGHPRPVGLAFDVGAYEVQGYGFALTAVPAARAIWPGETTAYALHVAPVGAFSDAVTLACSPAPPSVTLNLVPGTVMPGEIATLTVMDAHVAPLLPGISHGIVITGTGGGATTSTTVYLLVGGTRLYLPLAARDF